MKRFLAILFVVLAVALPLFAQSTVEKRSLSFYQKPANHVQLTGGLDFGWQKHNGVSLRGVGFRVGAECLLKNEFDLGLDASLMTMTDGELSKGPEVLKLTQTFGFHVMVGHATMVRMKVGAGTEVKLADNKADFHFTTEAGCNVYIKITDEVAIQFGGTCYATLPKGEDTAVTYSVVPGFGMAFTL